MSKRIIQIKIDADADHCGACDMWTDGDDGDYCEAFHRSIKAKWVVNGKPGWTFLRCDACKAAEVKRPCGCALDAPPCHCENDE